ncbi:MAG: MarR family winged helix-turn-helix transcriptional regulator, partial [Candidatus Dormibacteraceae bacterium]
MEHGRSARSQALQLGGLLFRAHLVARQAANDAMRDQDVELRDLGVLDLLVGGASETQHQIGARLGIDKSAMVRIVDGLERKGLVARRRRTDDRRAYAISITEAGRSRMGEAWTRA